MILPRVVKAVNSAPEYADLRRVYLSRVAAEWYRKLSLRKSTTYGGMIDKDDVSAYRTHEKWTPLDTFHAYVHSYTKGEFKVTHRTRKGNTIYTNTYIYGGVDFTTVPFTSLTADQAKATMPTLTRNVSQSLKKPTADHGKGQVWLGGGAPTLNASSDSGSNAAASGGGSGVWTKRGAAVGRWLLGAALITGAVMVRRAVRRRRLGRR